jgi:PAS domain S-box-containing protein
MTSFNPTALSLERIQNLALDTLTHQQKDALIQELCLRQRSTLSHNQQLQRIISMLQATCVENYGCLEIERALQQSEARLRAIFNNATVAIALIDQFGKFLQFNQNIIQVLGYQRNELERLNFLELIHPKDQATVSVFLQHLQHEPISNHRLEFRCLRKDGAILWLDNSVNIIYDNNHQLQAIVNVAVDITERKHAEIALRASEQRFRTIIEKNADGMMIIDANRVILFVNPAAEELWRKTATQLIGQTFGQVPVLEGQIELDTDNFIARTVNIRMVEIPWEGQTAYLASLHDFTDFKKIQDALARSEARLADAQRTAHLGNWEWDLITGEEQCSEEAYRILDIEPPKNLTPLHEIFEHALHPEDYHELMDAIERSIYEFTPYRATFRILWRDGTIHYIQGFGKAITNERGKVLRIVGTVQDITELKAFENALRESEAKFRSIYESTQAGIMVLRTDGKFQMVNPAFCEMLGYNDSELLTMRLFDVLHTDDLPYCTHSFNQLLDGSIRLIQAEKPFLHRQGRTVWTATNISLIRDAEGNVLYAIGLLQDITKEKSAEQALTESQRRYKTLATASPAGLFETNVDGVYTYVNEQVCRILGLSEAQILGMNWIDVLFHEERSYTLYEWEKCRMQHSHFHMEYRLQRHQEIIWVLGQIAPLFDQNNHLQGYVGTLTDITERKQMEEQLRAAETKYHTLVEQIPAVTYIRDLIEEYRICYISPQIEELTGFAVQEWLNDAELWFKLVHPDDLKDVLEESSQAIIENRPALSEYRLRTREGHIVWLHDRALVVRELQDSRPLIQGVAVDVTEQKRIEHELRENEHYRRTLIEEAQIGLILIRLDGTEIFEEVNPNFANIIGYTVEEIVGKLSIYDIIPMEYLRITQQRIEEASKNGRFSTYEQEYIHKAGYTVPVRISGLLIKRKGKTYIWANVESIREQKLAEANTNDLIFRLNQFKTTLDITLDGVFMFDAETLKLIYVNQGAIRQQGCSEFELLHMTFADLTLEHTHAQMVELLEPLQQDIASITIEMLHEHKTHGLFPVEVSIQYVQMQGQRSRFIAISRDITERKQADDRAKKLMQEMTKAKLAAETANRAKSTFLANMSHELRTPLNAILGYAQILKRDTTLNEQQHESVKIMQRSGEYLLNLINDILDLSKIEADRIEFYPVEFHLRDFLHSIIDLFQMRAKQKRITFNYQEVSPLPQMVRTDEKRLRQILINLLGNALKFTEQGRVDFRITYYPQTSQVRFEIQDTGIGIAHKHLGKIFLPFQQVGQDKYKSEGTGLGLAITQKLAMMMNSHIHVSSQLGVGSCFWFELELPELVDCTKKTHESSIITGYHLKFDGKLKICRVLVVDDKWENRAILTELLVPLGFEVQEAEHGAQCLEKAAVWLPDVILLDLFMPVMDGFETVQHLRARAAFKNTLIVAVSASAFDYHQHASFASGCDDFVAKPVQIDELLRCLQKHLKLSWITEEVEPPLLPEIDDLADECQIFSTSQIATLADLAQIGDIQGILDYLQQLEIEYGKALPIIKKIRMLAEDFQDHAIYEILHPCTQISSS